MQFFGITTFYKSQGIVNPGAGRDDTAQA